MHEKWQYLICHKYSHLAEEYYILIYNFTIHKRVLHRSLNLISPFNYILFEFAYYITIETFRNGKLYQSICHQ